MCNGEAQQLEDGQMMPRANIRSNSWRAILSRSGGSLCGWEATGGLVEGMWWVTVCFTGWSGGGGRSKKGALLGGQSSLRGIRKVDGWAGREFLG